MDATQFVFTLTGAECIGLITLVGFIAPALIYIGRLTNRVSVLERSLAEALSTIRDLGSKVERLIGKLEAREDA